MSVDRETKGSLLDEDMEDYPPVTGHMLEAFQHLVRMHRKDYDIPPDRIPNIKIISHVDELYNNAEHDPDLEHMNQFVKDLVAEKGVRVNGETQPSVSMDDILSALHDRAKREMPGWQPKHEANRPEGDPSADSPTGAASPRDEDAGYRGDAEDRGPQGEDRKNGEDDEERRKQRGGLEVTHKYAVPGFATMKRLAAGLGHLGRHGIKGAGRAGYRAYHSGARDPLLADRLGQKMDAINSMADYLNNGDLGAESRRNAELAMEKQINDAVKQKRKLFDQLNAMSKKKNLDPQKLQKIMEALNNDSLKKLHKNLMNNKNKHGASLLHKSQHAATEEAKMSKESRKLLKRMADMGAKFAKALMSMFGGKGRSGPSNAPG